MEPLCFKKREEVFIGKVSDVDRAFFGKTGSLEEYGQIEETMSPVALKVIGDWVVKHSR